LVVRDLVGRALCDAGVVDELLALRALKEDVVKRVDTGSADTGGGLDASEGARDVQRT
jgi:hypothetical protein